MSTVICDIVCDEDDVMLWICDLASVTCEPGWTKCRTVNSCIMTLWICDGEADCVDNSDEDEQICGTYDHYYKAVIYHSPSITLNQHAHYYISTDMSTTKHQFMRVNCY